MRDLEIHHLELKEAVLHERLCCNYYVNYPFVVALNPGKVNLSNDVCSYDKLSWAQRQISVAKVNYKKLLRLYANRWRFQDINVDLAISISMPIGKQRAMLSSLPAFHAVRAEKLFQLAFSADPVFDMRSEDFDPYLLISKEAWLFEGDGNE